MKESSIMAIKDILPWNRSKNELQERREGRESYDPIRALQLDLDRAFGEFWRAFDPSAPTGKQAGPGLPALPRVDTVAEGILTIRGEKKSEHETEEKGFVRRERSFGRVERVVSLPDGVDLDSAKATFKNGVLSVTFAKTPEAQAAVKRVQVQRA
jgi:HSP20 family protein